MADGSAGQIGSIDVDGGKVRFTYDPEGRVNGTFEDVVYRDASFETLLCDGWRDAVIGATGGAAMDMNARQMVFDDITAAARIADVHRRAVAALAAVGRSSSAEAAFLERSVGERLAAIKEKYGDIIRAAGETTVEGSVIPTVGAKKAPAGFENTPQRRGPDGAPAGYDLSKGFTVPAGFNAWFVYGPDAAVTAFDAHARIEPGTAARELLLPGWEAAFEAHVAQSSKRSLMRKLRAWMRRETLPTPEMVRAELVVKFKALLTAIYVHRQALLTLGRANMNGLPETVYLRNFAARTQAEALVLLGGKDMFR